MQGCFIPSMPQLLVLVLQPSMQRLAPQHKMMVAQLLHSASSSSSGGVGSGSTSGGGDGGGTLMAGLVGGLNQQLALPLHQQGLAMNGELAGSEIGGRVLQLCSLRNQPPVFPTPLQDLVCGLCARLREYILRLPHMRIRLSPGINITCHAAGGWRAHIDSAARCMLLAQLQSSMHPSKLLVVLGASATNLTRCVQPEGSLCGSLVGGG